MAQRGEMKGIIDCPELLKQWHFLKNENIQINNLSCGSGKKVWWKCPVADDHEWESRIVDRKRFGCPCCHGLKVVKSNCLATTHSQIAQEWHPIKNGKLTPWDVVSHSNKKVWWKCPVADDHEWEAQINNRINGKNCPCCAGRKVVKSNCLAILYPELTKQWHPTKNGNLTPNIIYAGGEKKVWWKCQRNHEWRAKIYERIKGKNCPFCNESKGEKAIAQILILLSIPFKRQWKFKSCKNKVSLPFDFVIKIKHKIKIIEYQGQQHYNPLAFGSKQKNPDNMLVNIQKRDRIKRDWCKDHNIPLLEIPYWNFNKINEIITEFI